MLFSTHQTLRSVFTGSLLIVLLGSNTTAQATPTPGVLGAAELLTALGRSTVMVANHADAAANNGAYKIRLVAHTSRLMNELLAFINHHHDSAYAPIFYNGFWGAWDAAALARHLRSTSPDQIDSDITVDPSTEQDADTSAEHMAQIFLRDIFPTIETAAAAWVAIDGWLDNPAHKNLRNCLQSVTSLSRTLQACLENRHATNAHRYLIPIVAHAVLTAWELYQLHATENQPMPITTTSTPPASPIITPSLVTIPSPVTVGTGATGTIATILTPRRAYFTEITGIDENAFKQLPTNTQQATYFVPNTADPKLNQIRNPQTGQTFYCGHLETLTIRDIRERVAQMDKAAAAPHKGTGTFNVIARMDNNPALLPHIDIANIQAQPENRNAVIQVASNFNGMEADGDPKKGVTWWCDDWTQGPAAAISGGPGAIYRCYFHAPFNLLDQTPLSVSNGKYCGYLGATEFAAKNPVLTDADYQNIAIGYHHHVQVTYGLSDLKQGVHAKVTDNNQIVDQVYTAAANLATFNAIPAPQQQNAIQTARMLVRAAYEGTIKSAYLAGKQRVYLTMVGGGVFNNPIAWIVDAINQNIPFIREHDMEVSLVIFGPSAAITQQNHTDLFAMTQQTNGTCRYYTTEHPDGVVRTT